MAPHITSRRLFDWPTGVIKLRYRASQAQNGLYEPGGSTQRDSPNESSIYYLTTERELESLPHWCHHRASYRPYLETEGSIIFWVYPIMCKKGIRSLHHIT